MHRLTGGRFTLGLGRGIEPLFDAFGMPADHDRADRGLRRADAPAVAGRGRSSATTARPGRTRCSTSTRRSTRTSRSASSPSGPTRSRSPAGLLDMVVLHTFFTDETTARAVRHRAPGGRGGGPRPRRRCASGRASPPSATTSPTTLRLKKTVGRLATYLQGYGDLMVRTNGWDPAVLERFRADAVVQSVRRGHRPGRHHRPARAHRHAAARRVAGAGGHGHARARAPSAVLAPVRPRRRRRDHARRQPRRARAGRRRLPGAAARPAGSTTWPPTPAPELEPTPRTSSSLAVRLQSTEAAASLRSVAAPGERP